MILDITPLQKENLPVVQLPDKNLLVLLGEQGVRKMVNDHYNLLRTSDIGHLFAMDDDEFERAKLRSSDFFIQILGGKPYFNENRGKPMLVQRHSPFRISPKGRITWLTCYIEVLKKLEIEESVILSFWHYIDALSMRMVNSEDEIEFRFNFGN